MSDAFSRWANRLSLDKLAMDKVSDKDRAKLVELCAELGKRFPDAKGHDYVHRMHFRKDVCNTAIDLGIDLMAVKGLGRYKGHKPLIGRGLLDVWMAVCTERFGSVVGTAAWFEDKRRKVSTLNAERRWEETRALKTKES